MTGPGEDIMLRLSSLHELRLRVGADHDLGCVEIEVDGLAHGHSCIMAPNHALDLALRLTAACAQLRQIEPREDPGPPNLGLGSLDSRFERGGTTITDKETSFDLRAYSEGW